MPGAKPIPQVNSIGKFSKDFECENLPAVDEGVFKNAQQIKASDAHSEIMDLAGELKVARIEI